MATTLNKSEIMRAAWVIVRRFKGDLAQRLSRANLWAFECKDTMRGSDWQRLDAARAALAQAEAREPVAA